MSFDNIRRHCYSHTSLAKQGYTLLLLYNFVSVITVKSALISWTMMRFLGYFFLVSMFCFRLSYGSWLRFYIFRVFNLHFYKTKIYVDEQILLQFFASKMKFFEIRFYHDGSVVSIVLKIQGQKNRTIYFILFPLFKIHATFQPFFMNFIITFVSSIYQ